MNAWYDTTNEVHATSKKIKNYVHVLNIFLTDTYDTCQL